MHVFFIVFLFVFGICIGSFLNVYIHRYCKNEEQETKENILSPKRSYCPCCGNTIAWYDNIPLLSYILLKGKCRKCKNRIPLRYFLVEVFTGLFTVFLYYFFIIKASDIRGFVISLLMVYGLIAVTVIDLKIMVIPDEISLGGIFVGIICSLIYPKMHIFVLYNDFFIKAHPMLNAFIASIVGVIVGAGMLSAIGVLGTKVFKKEAMGGGDVKLLGMIGAFLGYRAVLLIIFVASLLGTFSSVVLLMGHKSKIADHIAFGPFLAMASVVVMLFQKNILYYLFGIVY